MSAKVPEPSARVRDDALADLEGLRAWHAQAREQLVRLGALARRLEADDPDPAARADAGAIEAFFSGTARRHHAAVERELFPGVIAAGDADRVATVRRLQQDHGWIDENWIELGPKLRAIADDNHWIDPAEFVHDADVFRELVGEHIELESSLLGA